MNKMPVQAEVVFKLPGDSFESRIAFVGEHSKVLTDPRKLQQLLELIGLPEGATAKVLYTTDDVVVR